MKNIFTKTFALTLMLLLGINSIWAETRAGFWGEGAATIRFNRNGSQQDITMNSSKMNAISLGNIQSLSIKEWWFKMWQSADNIPGDGISFCYKLYQTGETAPESFVVNYGNYINYGDWADSKRNPQAGNNAADLDLTATLAPGEYTLEFYYTANMNVEGTSTEGSTTQYLSNGGQNYKITFTHCKPATASNHLFGTFQASAQPLYQRGDGKHLLYQDINFFVATCGDVVIGKLVKIGRGMWNNENMTSIRIWNDEKSSSAVANLNAFNEDGEVSTKWTADADMNNNKLRNYGEVFPMSFYVQSWASSNAECKSDFYTYRRNYINNPIDDEVAPTLNLEGTTIDDSGENIVVTFGEVTADDEYFYYVADEKYNLAAISLNNIISIAKPANEDGKIYNFICCAVDYNGNLSEIMEYSYTDTFNPKKNLALNKPSEAGTQQGDGVKAPKANNGDESDFWTCFGTGTPDQWWWSVDLGDNYDVNRVRILFNDHAGSFQILSSVDGNDWSEYASEAAGYPVDITYHTLASARYFKFVSTAANVGIKEFEVYGIGIHTEDTEAPVITSASIDPESVTDVAATIHVTATDNIAVATCRLVDNTNKIDKTFDYNEGVLVLTNLAPSTTYTFTVTVADLAGNVSEPWEMDAFTTLANTNIPSTAAATPAHDIKDVINVYCTQYGGSATVEIANAGWNWQYTSYEKVELFSTEHYLVKDCGSFGLKPRQSVSGMDYLHVDLWAKEDMNGYVLIENIGARQDFTISAGQWTSIDLPVTDKTPGQNWIMIYLGNSGSDNGKTNHVDLYVTNAYFWKKTSHDLAVSAAGYASLYLPFAAKIPDGVEVFTGKYDADESTLTLETLTQQTVIPARTAVVVKAAEKTYTFDEEVSADEIDKRNDLLGVLEETNASELVDANHVALTLGKKDGKVGFYQPAGGIIGANKIYLIVDKPAGQTPAPVRIVMPSDVATSTENIISGEAAQKLLINGQLHIVRDGKTFDLTGRIIK